MKKAILTLITLTGISISSSFAGSFAKQLSATGDQKSFQQTITINATASVNVSSYAYRSVQWSTNDFVNSTILIRNNGSLVGEAAIQIFPYMPVMPYNAWGSYSGYVSQLEVYMTVWASAGNTSVAQVSASW